MIPSRGVLRYSPKLLGERQSEKWWLVVDCDPEIGKYFRHLYHIGNWRCRQIQRAAWAEHISVIRNEEPPPGCRGLWEKYASLSVDFTYEPVVYSNGLYFWLPVSCERVLEIREELGLPRQPEYPLHLTIGNAHGSEVQGDVPGHG